MIPVYYADFLNDGLHWEEGKDLYWNYEKEHGQASQK